MTQDSAHTCAHKETWFSRQICPEPCGSMHYYCEQCGARTEPCPWEDSND